MDVELSLKTGPKALCQETILPSRARLHLQHYGLPMLVAPKRRRNDAVMVVAVETGAELALEAPRSLFAGPYFQRENQRFASAPTASHATAVFS